MLENSSSSWLLPKTNQQQALYYFNFYRLTIASLFLLFIRLGLLPQGHATYNSLFSTIATTYFLTSVLLFVLIIYKTPNLSTQIIIQVFADIIFIPLLIYSNYGIATGFGNLLLVSIIIGSVLTNRKLALLFAATSSLLILFATFYSKVTGFISSLSYTQAGLLGTSFFLTAYLAHSLALKATKNAALASERTQDLVVMSEINELIVKRMHTGILLTDKDLNLYLSNHAAISLLQCSFDKNYKTIYELCPDLAKNLNNWLKYNEPEQVILNPIKGQQIQVTFARPGWKKKFEVLVFIDSIALITQHAQQIKLTSLGHLAANIAHEIRNPLTAISHAGQLLQETRYLKKEEHRLVGMITEHAHRISRIIDNVLYLSRRKATLINTVPLKDWLKNKFIIELIGRYKLSQKDIVINMPDNLTVYASTEQLHQILWNLSENALRYSVKIPRLTFSAGRFTANAAPYLDIIDQGTGIFDEVAEQLFEPFFTTENTGSGLGLYIARELCEANQARLSLYKSTANGSIFRIEFARQLGDYSV